MKFKTKDWILLAVILSLIILGSIFYFYSKKPGKVLRVIKNNEIIEELNLNEDIRKEYTSGSDLNTLVIQNGTANVVSANCDNQICVNTAPISEVGETIACLPHGLIFEVAEN